MNKTFATLACLLGLGIVRLEAMHEGTKKCFIAHITKPSINPKYIPETLDTKKPDPKKIRQALTVLKKLSDNRLEQTYKQIKDKIAHVGYHSLLETPLSVTKRGSTNQTLLHLACGRGNLKMAAVLIAQGADFMAIDSDGNTPLQLAQRAEKSAVIKFLQAINYWTCLDPKTDKKSPEQIEFVKANKIIFEILGKRYKTQKAQKALAQLERLSREIFDKECVQLNAQAQKI